MSERQLARVAGLSHATVNHLITGRRTGCTLATAHAIEAALGVGPGILFDNAPVEAEWQVDVPAKPDTPRADSGDQP
jgi:DNA-binding Xre family transcriptional regulator